MNALLQELDVTQARIRGLIEAHTKPDAGPRLFRKALDAGARSGALTPQLVAQAEHLANRMDRHSEELDFATMGVSKNAAMLKSVRRQFRKGRMPLVECEQNQLLIGNGLAHLLQGQWAV